jgi:hypothetical protein
MRYAGLTDDPALKKQEHGNPADWTVVKGFSREEDARKWLKYMLLIGYQGKADSPEWKYGYTYTIDLGTRQ